MPTGCHIRIKVGAVDTSRFEAEWRVQHTRNGSYRHNHTSAEDVRVYAAHRRRSVREVAAAVVTLVNLITLQAEARVSVSRIYATLLHSNQKTLATPKDISNALSAVRMHDLAYKTSVEALLQALAANGFWFKYAVDENNRQFPQCSLDLRHIRIRRRRSQCSDINSRVGTRQSLLLIFCESSIPHHET